jgi:U6 snRNA-associated Sm-like protein LSm8
MHSSGTNATSNHSVFSKDEGCENVPIGLYIVRGDSVSVVCSIDEERDAEMDWTAIRVKGQGIKSIHGL